MAANVTKDMTEGSPVKLILGFFIPMLCGLLFQQLYNMADTIIVGKCLGVKALAAVGSTGSVNFMIIGFCLGVCSGFAIPVAQKFGEKNEKALRRFVANSAWLAILFSAVMTVTVCLLCRNILELMQTPEDIIDGAYSYIFVIFLGIPATYLYNLLSCTIRSLGDSTTPLIFLVFSSVVNVALDFFTILVLKMGVSGAACATVLSQLVSAVLCFLRIKSGFPILHISKNDLEWERERMRILYQNGLAMALMSSLVNCGTLILQTGINKLGTNIIVAHTAARKVFEIFSLPVSVFGASMATYCGQNYGAGKYDRIRQGLKAVLGIGCVFSVIIFILSHTISPYLISFIASSKNKEVIYWGTQYLVYDMSFQVVCVFIVILRNSLQGIGDQRTPVFSSFIELAGKVVFTLVFVRRFGYWAVIWTEPVIWICMVIPLIVTAAGNPVLFGKQK